MQTITLPTDPLVRFVDLYEALARDRGFWGDASSLRFAALTAVTCPGSARAIAKAIRAAAEEIKTRSGWFGALNSPLRFPVSALLVRSGDSPTEFLGEVERVHDIFRQHRLRRGGIYETMAILILRQQHDLAPIPDAAVERFRALYEEMKRHHWWLTGPDDFPACAILAAETGSAEEIGDGVEAIYQALDARGFSKGDALQTAANILYLAHVNPQELAQRYERLAAGFGAAGVSIWRSDYDELAILSFLEHPPARVVEKVLGVRLEMTELRPKPDCSLTFNLASGIAFLELVQLDTELKRISDAKALMDMQSVLNAQQAAAAAAASSAAVAASSASS